MEANTSRNHLRWRAPVMGLFLALALVASLDFNPVSLASLDFNPVSLASLDSPAAAAVPQQDSPTAATVLDQPPGDGSARLADAQDLKSVAENFILNAPATVTQIVLWGGYADEDTPPATDNFTMHFFTDSGGWLGAPIYSESAIAYSRVQTGDMDSGIHVWRHTLTLATPVSLAPGTYWLWYHNHTPGSPDNYQSSAGSLDGTNGIAGSWFNYVGSLETYWVTVPEERALRLVQWNNPPVAEDEDYAAAFETPLTVAAEQGVLDNDSDVDGDPLAAVLDSGPIGQLSLNADGSFVYTPTLDFRGPDIFTYHADDGIAASAVATVTIGVLSPPSITLASPEDGAKDVALGEDVVVKFNEAINTATFTYTVAPDPGGWTEAWNGATTQVTLNHDDFERWTTVTFTVTGAEGLAGTAMEDPYVWSFTTEPYRLFMPLMANGGSHPTNRR